MVIRLDENYNAMTSTALLGYVGETNARPVSVEGLTVDGADRYVLTIDYGDGVTYEVDITGGTWTPTADILRVARNVSCQISARKYDNGNYTLVKKSKIFSLRIGQALSDGVAPIPSPSVAADALDKIDAIGRQAHADMQTAVTAAEAATTAAENAKKSATATEKSADTATQAANRAETAKAAAETSATQADTARQGAETARQQAVTAQNAAKISADLASASAKQTTADKTATAGYAQTAKTNADSTAADRQAVADMAAQVTADKATVADNTAKVATDRKAAETAAQTAQAVADSLPDDYVTAVGKIAENTAEINNTNNNVSQLKEDLDGFATGTNINISISGEKTVQQSINFLKGYNYTLYNGTTKITGKITLTADDGTTKELNGLAINKSLDFVADKNYSLISFYANAGGIFTITGKGVLDLFNDTKTMIDDVDINAKNSIYGGVKTFDYTEGTRTLYYDFKKNEKYTITNYGVHTGMIHFYDLNGVATDFNGIGENSSFTFVADKDYIYMTCYYSGNGQLVIENDGINNSLKRLINNNKETMQIISKDLVWKVHDDNQRIKSYPIFVNKGDKLININNKLKIIINIYSDFYKAKTIYDSDGSYGANGDIYASDDWKSGNASITIPFSGYLIVRAVGINTDIVSNIEFITTHTIPQIVEENKDAISNIYYAKRRYSTGENDAKNKPYITTFAHFSDVHGASTSVQRVLDFVNYSNTIDDIICTGDIVRDHFSDGMNYWSFIDGSEKILNVIGNHDAVIDSSNWNNLVTQAERYEAFIAPYASNWGAITTENKSYYYKDYASSKMRMVVLDCMLKEADETEQNTWLAGVLSSAKASGYDVVIAEHYPPANANKIDCTFTNSIRNIQSYNVLSTVYQQTVQSFINDGGSFVCYLAGHTHNDQVLYNTDYPQQIFIMVDTADYGINAECYSDTARIYGEKSQDLFNIVSIDTYAKLIKIIRIGADKDCLMRSKKYLTLNYSNQTVLVND